MHSPQPTFATIKASFSRCLKLTPEPDNRIKLKMNPLSGFVLLIVLGLTQQYQPDASFETIQDLEKRALLRHLIQQGELDNFPDRIIGGEEAGEAEAPFQIALHQKYFGLFKRFLCGGSLISSRTVLSAGHCVIKSASYAVRYGTNNRQSSPFPDNDVAKIILHPQFNLSTVQNDLALFIMNKPVSPSSNVRSIELQDSGVAANTSLTLFGFGLTNGYGNTPSKTLQKSQLNVVDEEECKSYIESLQIEKHPGMLCAQHPSSSACNGDSGGPLVVSETRKQLGIVSFGTRFCPVGSMNVFTNVSYYSDWIKQNLVE